MIHLGPHSFDHHTYDAEGDVLYMAIGEPRPAADSPETPEGHIVRYDEEGGLIGITLVNAKWLLERDGALSVTLPERSAAADPRELEALLG